MVNLTHEGNLLQKIDVFYARGKIQSTVGLTAENARSKIKQLIPTTRQHLNAAKFYLDSMGNIDYAAYLRGEPFPPVDQRPQIDFFNNDLQGQINLLTPDALPSIVFLILRNEEPPDVQILKLNPNTLRLIVFLVVSGFLSHLVSSEDCLAKIINIVYDLIPYNKRYLGSDIRKELKNKIPNGKLVRHLRSFHAVTRTGGQDIENKKGTPFNIAKQIRNQLTHDDITDIIEFPPTMTLSGFVDDSDLKLHFQKLFFPIKTVHDNTEITTFCRHVFKETVGFIDQCYRLILGKLRNRGCLPIK